MTLQPPLPLVPATAVEVGAVAALVEDADGGRVFLRGEVIFAWGTGDEAGRRLAAVQLVELGIAKTGDVAAAFGASPGTVWRWRQERSQGGVAGLVPAKRGPKGPSKLSPEVVADIRARRETGASLRTIAGAVEVSTGSVRRALAPGDEAGGHGAATAAAMETTTGAGDLPVLGEPAPRTVERAAARWHLIEAAAPVFAPAARMPLAGLFLALPALETTGLLPCAKDVYGKLPAGFYGLDTMLLEGVLRVLAGQPRAEGAGRFDPVDLGRVLGMDRAPEVKTIRRKISQLAEQNKAGDLLAAMAAHHLHQPPGTGQGDQGVGVVLYVDGHVRAYQGQKKIAKTHLSRLRFPAPATVETWVTDAAGDPVLVVMSEPGASLAAELRRLLPKLRKAVGDDRRVLVGFDRGGWSPALFAHMHAHGFDVLTWRKGHTDDLTDDLFAEARFTDDTGREHTWTLAETMVDLPVKDRGGTFAMRQVTRADTKNGHTKQVHVLTTRTDLPAAQIIYRMGSRWRQENYFRYARLHLGLDSHDSYAATPDDPDRSVPNPIKRHAHQAAQNAYARVERERARTDAALLAARTPAPGQEAVVVTNKLHNALTADLRTAQDELAAARENHRQVPTRVRLGDLAPGQQVLDTETKLVHHAIKIAAFNTTTAIARDIRIHTGYARADQEAYTLTRQILTQSGDIIPDTTTGTLTIRLDPLPTTRETAAASELCEHLTATATTYPGTNLLLRYTVKKRQ